MIRCVMFDFGHVLMHFDTRRFFDFVITHQQPGSMAPEDFFRSECVEKYELGLIDEFKFFEEAKRSLGVNVEMNEFFFMFTDVMKPDLRMIALKQTLQKNGFKTAVVSNTNQCHIEHTMKKWPEVLMDFDHLALSFFLGARKPDPKIFDMAAEPLAMSPAECFFVDDLEVNISAFKKWGGTGHYYNVTDSNFMPNGWLDIERRKLVFRMASMKLISYTQAMKIAGFAY